MGALKDLLKSEKGLFCGLLILAASVMTGTGQMDVGQWTDFSMGIAAIYTGGKALQGGAAAIANGKSKVDVGELVEALAARLSENDSAADKAAAALPSEGDGQ